MDDIKLDLAYPIEISGAEPIVRAIRDPHHLGKGGRLLPSAFRPQRGKSSASVVRWRYRDPATVKQRLWIAANQGKNRYVGVAALTAESVIASGARLEDARNEYQGHAHMVFPITVPAVDGEPLENPPELLAQNKIANALIACSRFISDVKPDDPDDTLTAAIDEFCSR